MSVGKSAAEPRSPHNSTVFAWGSHKDGQLGLGGIEEAQMLIPTELTTFCNRPIKHIACGQEHTIFVMEDGTVYTCGNNDRGQLGHGKTKKKPGRLWSKQILSEAV